MTADGQPSLCPLIVKSLPKQQIRIVPGGSGVAP
jgi:hypothetical protein